MPVPVPEHAAGLRETGAAATAATEIEIGAVAVAAGVAGVAVAGDAVGAAGPRRTRLGDIGAGAKRRAELDSVAWRETKSKDSLWGSSPKRIS